MAGKRVLFSNIRNSPSPSSLWAKPSTLIFGLTVAVLILTSFLFYSYTRQQNPRFAITDSYARYTGPEYSFVASLEEFLKTRAPFPGSETESDGSAAAGSLKLGADPVFDERALDPSMLKVYVYDMPSKFTYDLLWLFRNTYKETENLTSNGSPVHRLIEQHSIDYWLWADLIAPESSRLLKNVIRVQRQEEADLFYIPFFTTISFFLMEKQQCKRLYREALKWVTDQPAWKRSEGRDHILPVHHPWSFKSVRRFMKKAIWLLPDMDSTGNWYKPGQVYLEKDVILPYVANVDVCDAKCLSETESQRKTLLFFRGRLKRNAGGKIRAKLVDELRNKEGVIIDEGTIGQAGKKAAQDGMRRSVFCLNPAGDTPSSARLFDAIVSGCIPVIVSDELELPFEGILNYHKSVGMLPIESLPLYLAVSRWRYLFHHMMLYNQAGLLAHLKAIDPSKIRDMRVNLAQSVRHFLYSSPAQPWGPEDLTWRMIAGKLLNIKLHIRRSQRMVEGSRNLCTCECMIRNRTATNPADP